MILFSVTMRSILWCISLSFALNILPLNHRNTFSLGC